MNDKEKFEISNQLRRCIQLYGSDYPDDIAFFYGDKKIYVNRHIKRLLEEISEKINKR